MSAKVIQQNDFTYFSIQMLARAFGKSRATVSKVLTNIQPTAKRGGFPVYALNDVAVFIGDIKTGDNGEIDPETIKDPFERKAWYESENKRLQFENEIGRLLVADDVAAIDAEKNKRIALRLDTLVDVVEREAGLTPEQSAVVIRIVDSMRDDLFNDICNIEIEAGNAG